MSGHGSARARSGDLLRRHRGRACGPPRQRRSRRASRPRRRCTPTFGGVYPELASRAHIDKILPTVQAVLSESGVRPRDLAAIGVTRGPGLIGSLMVGLNTAAGLGHGWEVPVIGVNHLRGAPAQRGPGGEPGQVPGDRAARLRRAHAAGTAREHHRHPPHRLDGRRLGRRGVRQGRPHAGAGVPRRPRHRPARAQRDAAVAIPAADARGRDSTSRSPGSSRRWRGTSRRPRTRSPRTWPRRSSRRAWKSSSRSAAPRSRSTPYPRS